jgi:hypothetical protein
LAVPTTAASTAVTAATPRVEQGRSTEHSAGEPECRREKREGDGQPTTDSDPVARMRERRSRRRAGEQLFIDHCTRDPGGQQKLTTCR